MSGTTAKQRYTFTSYLCTEALNICDESSDLNHLKPKLLMGELEVASAPVFMYPQTEKFYENDQEGTQGLLVVTNYKLAFMSNNSREQYELYQENIFLGRNDVTLENIDVIYLITDKKKKKLAPQQKVSSKVDALHILCKNFRLLKFSFKLKEQGRYIAQALAKFAYPMRHDLSFAYCFKENYYNTVKSTVTMFNSKNDWSRELIRCGATEWRVLSSEAVNCKHLPKYFVIPKCFEPAKFLEFAKAFCDYRSAFWVYGFGSASLIRMGEVKQEEDTKIENVTLELVRKCDPEKRSLAILILSDLLPSIQDVQRGYVKLRELCTPDSARKFLIQDSKYLNLVDKTGWLLYVSLCLKTSADAAKALRNGTTVVLQENNGRDMSCVISSLTQIILDPYFRTVDGFQSLIQKEWVALEHPFLDRLGHISGSDEEKESPLLLLFLDCVWQLLQQFPTEFEYSETYLTTVWDSAFLPIFDTFQFNSENDRTRAINESNLVLRPVWDWNEQFSEKDQIFFTNPLYVKKADATIRKMSVIPANAVALPGMQIPSRFTINQSKFANPSSIPKDRYLEPRWGISHLEIWQQCYYRWMPILEIKNGGFPQIDIFHRALLSNISKLQRAIDSGDYDGITENFGESLTSDEAEQIYVAGVKVSRRCKWNNETGIRANNLPPINSFFPFSLNTKDSPELTDILTHSNEVLLMEGSIMERMSIAQLPD